VAGETYGGSNKTGVAALVKRRGGGRRRQQPAYRSAGMARQAFCNMKYRLCYLHLGLCGGQAAKAGEVGGVAAAGTNRGCVWATLFGSSEKWRTSWRRAHAKAISPAVACAHFMARGRGSDGDDNARWAAAIMAEDRRELSAVCLCHTVRCLFTEPWRRGYRAA